MLLSCPSLFYFSNFGVKNPLKKSTKQNAVVEENLFTVTIMKLFWNAIQIIIPKKIANKTFHRAISDSILLDHNFSILTKIHRNEVYFTNKKHKDTSYLFDQKIV